MVLDVFLWMVLIVSIVKVAKKADEIITRIGLNPAITGNRSSLPGVIAYTVFRTALSMVTKGAANGIGGAAAGGPRYGGGRKQTSQTDSRQEQQFSSQHTAQQNTSQTSGQRQTASQERTAGGQRTGPSGTFRPERSSRKTSVQPGTAGTAPDFREGQAPDERRRPGFPPRHGRNSTRLPHPAGPEAERRAAGNKLHQTDKQRRRTNPCIANPEVHRA